MAQLVQSSEWTISAVFLLIVAWHRFNTPPTNRSGTTFVLSLFRRDRLLRSSIGAVGAGHHNAPTGQHWVR
jgi:hypothetical protein